MSESHPAHALVRALAGKHIVEATCDGEGIDDVRLRLADGTTILIDATVVDDPPDSPWPLGPTGRLVVQIGGDELWPFIAS